MAIRVNLDVEMAKRKLRSNELARMVGITEQNLSILKTGKARAIRFSTLSRLCGCLGCAPGDLLAYEPDAEDGSAEQDFEGGAVEPGAEDDGPGLDEGGAPTAGL